MLRKLNVQKLNMQNVLPYPFESPIDNKVILCWLERVVKYRGLKLPSNLHFRIDDHTNTLFLSLDSHVSSTGEVLFPCVMNMQTDESCFEGWSLSLKHHLPFLIEFVVLQWDIPILTDLSESEKCHYNRFLYRVLRMSEMFPWFTIADDKRVYLENFSKELVGLANNAPQSMASKPSERGAKEKLIEHAPENLQTIKNKLGLSAINHQFPVGVQKNGKSFFTGRGSAIDIWGLDSGSVLHLFELKYKNFKVGIISELMFYSEVMYDLFVSGRISKPGKLKNVRDEEILYTVSSLSGICAYFLFDQLHPLVKGVTALLNTNQYGIRFFNLNYKMEKDSFRFTLLNLKGGLQLQEEVRQAYYRHEVGLAGKQYILQKGVDNLYQGASEAIRYFKENQIDWWHFGNQSPQVPTTHMVSSQIQCLNYLFPLRKNQRAVMQLLQMFDERIDRVYPFPSGDFIEFEFTYHNERILGENDKGAKRGVMCTSIDAFIIAGREDKKILVPIEWKYTEQYLMGANKALELHGGTKRQSRYNELIKHSWQLKDYTDMVHSCYYYEPFYELMRQTLLVEGMVKERVADDFLHILIIPGDNKDFLGNSYLFSKEDFETIWKSNLKHPEKFKIVDSRKIQEEVIFSINHAWAKYLRDRYLGGLWSWERHTQNYLEFNPDNFTNIE